MSNVIQFPRPHADPQPSERPKFTNWELKTRARGWFATANGWSIGKAFSIQTLAGMRGWRHSERDRMDHQEWYRSLRNGRPGAAAAIVGHNYPGDRNNAHYGIDGPRELAEFYGLALHVAPAGAQASWHFPGHSVLLVMTPPGVDVVWPTDEEMDRTSLDYWRMRGRDSIPPEYLPDPLA
jgi:hypothetical protein